MRILIVMLALWSCNTESKRIKKDNKILLDVHFQDFFQKDKVTFFFEDCLILKDEELNSDKSVGLTDMTLEVQQKKSDYVVMLKNKEEIICEMNNDSLKLKVIVNQVESVFSIDLNKGKYIGFDKEITNKVKLNQSIEPFEYD